MISILNIMIPFLIMDTQTWSSRKNRKKGDHIRVSRGLYYHHGIYISDNEVIHFSGVKSDSILHWENCRVISTDLDTFLCGGKLEIKIYSKCDSKKLKNIDDIISLARRCVGQSGYSLFTNNCEHFANYCTINKKISHQVENFICGKLPINIVPSMLFLAYCSIRKSNNTNKKIIEKNAEKKRMVKKKSTMSVNQDSCEKISIKIKTNMKNYHYISDEEFE